MASKVKCTCGHSWNKSDSSKKDVNVCHVCGKDNTMKNGGWLDNYGEADNANDSDVSLPEDFNGLSYDTTGRDYSPAWGGQFQQGGSIPGSQGFTYARTGDIPSNGKYAKKTMASAQNGKEMKFYQEGLDWKPKSMQDGGEAQKTPEQIKIEQEKIKKARETAFKTIQPSNYDDLKNMARWATNTKRETYDDPRSEEFWGNYLKQSKDLKYLRPSEYSPTIAKKKDAKYLSVDDELEQAIFNSFKDSLEPNQIKQANETDIPGKYDSDVLQDFISANPGLGDRNPSGSIARALGNFTVSKGNDEKGDYVSYYDTYDFPDWIQNRVKGEPYEIYGRIYYPEKKKNGGIIKDNQGYWNPENHGKVVEIDSNNITMQGVNQSLLGVSDQGDVQYMEPGKDYKFKGSKVREYPIARLGINDLDAQPMKKLNQLTNFTNNPDKNNWLDKYN